MKADNYVKGGGADNMGCRQGRQVKGNVKSKKQQAEGRQTNTNDAKKEGKLETNRHNKGRH